MLETGSDTHVSKTRVDDPISEDAPELQLVIILVVMDG